MISPLFFQSAAWFDVLNEGFGARSHRMNGTLAVTFFRIGPLGVAYANFPVGIRTVEALDAVMQPETRRTLKAMGADLLRFSVPESIAQGRSSGGFCLPETCIHNLADWSEQGLDSDVRYEIRRARREGIQVRPAHGSDAPFMFDLYRLTVKRHGGRLRYTPGYFSAICKLAESAQEVSGQIAETPEQTPCGFVVVARAGDTAYYLHAGFDSANAKRRPGYALMCAAMNQARNDGCVRFNLMASPVNQPTLVRFKEKWGGQTRPLINLDIPLSTVGHIARLGLKVRQRLSCRRRP